MYEYEHEMAEIGSYHTARHAALGCRVANSSSSRRNVTLRGTRSSPSRHTRFRGGGGAQHSNSSL